MASPQDGTTLGTTHPLVEYLQGVIERLTFHSEESGYTVARLHVPGQRELITIIGRFPAIERTPA
jgi:exodeoxyribonuclease V alpha subunit